MNKKELLERIGMEDDRQVFILVGDNLLHQTLGCAIDSMLDDMNSNGEEEFLNDEKLQEDLSNISSFRTFKDVYDKWFSENKIALKNN